jgi:cell division protein FtsZ
MFLEFENDSERCADLRVVGVGGAGGNAINRMLEAGLAGVQFVAANTDAQALGRNLASRKIQLGGRITNGLGAGGDWVVGRKAAEEDEALIGECLEGADMVFVTAGMGGGTGTGAAPIVSAIAKQSGALTVAIVTRPFLFEGKQRSRVAEQGLEELRQHVDTLIVIPNEKLLAIVDTETPLNKAFTVADEVLFQATKGISDLITETGEVNLDFADVKSVMGERGNALMGTGVSSGPQRALEAANAAVSSPLLDDVSISGAQAVLVNISGGQDLTLHEVSEVTNIVTAQVGADANVIFGAVIQDELEGQLSVTVIATGFGKQKQPHIGEMQKGALLGFKQSGTQTLRKPAFKRKEESERKDESQPVWSVPKAKESLDVPAFLRRHI